MLLLSVSRKAVPAKGVDSTPPRLLAFRPSVSYQRKGAANLIMFFRIFFGLPPEHDK